HGQEVWASANAPSGTTANNQGWGYIKPGGVVAGIPAWFNGINVRSGGGYLVGGLNNKTGFINCYAEDPQVNQFDKLATRYEPFMSYAYLVSAGVLYGPASEFGASRLVTTSDTDSVM